MDIPTLSRFAPEAAVLAIAGYFALRSLQLFKEIVDKMSKEQQQSLHELSKAIDKNTRSNEALIKASEEQHEFMKRLNGRLAGAAKATIEENSYER